MEDVISVLSMRRLYKKNQLQLRDRKTECQSSKNKYPEAASVAQQVYKVFSAGCTLVTVGDCSERNSIVNSAEEKRTNFATQ
jgi:hypothetical protein